MPAKSKAQARLMRAAARDPKVARKHGISRSTAREFVRKTRSTKGLPQRKRRKKSGR